MKQTFEYEVFKSETRELAKKYEQGKFDEEKKRAVLNVFYKKQIAKIFKYLFPKSKIDVTKIGTDSLLKLIDEKRSVFKLATYEKIKKMKYGSTGDQSSPLSIDDELVDYFDQCGSKKPYFDVVIAKYYLFKSGIISNKIRPDEIMTIKNGVIEIKTLKCGQNAAKIGCKVGDINVRGLIVATGRYKLLRDNSDIQPDFVDRRTALIRRKRYEILKLKVKMLPLRFQYLWASVSKYENDKKLFDSIDEAYFVKTEALSLTKRELEKELNLIPAEKRKKIDVNMIIGKILSSKEYKELSEKKNDYGKDILNYFKLLMKYVSFGDKISPIFKSSFKTESEIIRIKYGMSYKDAAKKYDQLESLSHYEIFRDKEKSLILKVIVNKLGFLSDASFDKVKEIDIEALQHYLFGNNMYGINYFKLVGYNKKLSEMVKGVFNYSTYRALKLLMATVGKEDVLRKMTPSQLKGKKESLKLGSKEILMTRFRLADRDMNRLYVYLYREKGFGIIRVPALFNYMDLVKNQMGKSPSMQKEISYTFFMTLKAIRNAKGDRKKIALYVENLVTSLKGIDLSMYKLKFDDEKWKKDIVKGYETIRPGNEIMSNVDGRIKGLMVTIPYNRNRRMVAEMIYQVLRHKMKEKDFKLTVLGLTDYFKYFLKKKGFKLDKSKVKFIPVFMDNYGTYWSNQWVRDGAIRRSNGTILETHFWRQNATGRDAERQYDRVAMANGVRLQKSKLMFEGGNIRADKFNVFIGVDCIIRTAGQMKGITGATTGSILKRINKGDIEKAIKAFRKEFGKNVVVLGGSRDESGKLILKQNQQNYHIDLSMTLIGNKTVLLSEPEIGIISVGGKRIRQSDIERYRKDKLRYAGEINGGMRDTLISNKYRIVRLPSVNFGGLVINYNNALVEKYVDKKTGKMIKRVYLPQYYGENKGDNKIIVDDIIKRKVKQEDVQLIGGSWFGMVEGEVDSSSSNAKVTFDLAKLNKRAAEVYRKLGYQVIPISTDVRSVSEYKGALNCIAFEIR